MSVVKTVLCWRPNLTECSILSYILDNACYQSYSRTLGQSYKLLTRKIVFGCYYFPFLMFPGETKLKKQKNDLTFKEIYTNQGLHFGRILGKDFTLTRNKTWWIVKRLRSCSPFVLDTRVASYSKYIHKIREYLRPRRVYFLRFCKYDLYLFKLFFFNLTLPGN